MRTAIVFLMLITISAAVFIGCNSHESAPNGGPRTLLQGDKPRQTPPQTQPVQNPADNARRITADELHKLWQNNEVLIVDTRNEASFKQSHIKGAILIPAGEFASRADELPKDKMIVAYCT